MRNRFGEACTHNRPRAVAGRGGRERIPVVGASCQRLERTISRASRRAKLERVKSERRPTSDLSRRTRSDRGFTLSVVRKDAVFDLNRSSYLNLNNSFTAKTIF